MKRLYSSRSEEDVAKALRERGARRTPKAVSRTAEKLGLRRTAAYLATVGKRMPFLRCPLCGGLRSAKAVLQSQPRLDAVLEDRSVGGGPGGSYVCAGPWGLDEAVVRNPRLVTVLLQRARAFLHATGGRP